MTVLRLIRLLHSQTLDTLGEQIGSRKSALSVAETHGRLASRKLRAKLAEYYKTPYAILGADVDATKIAAALLKQLKARR